MLIFIFLKAITSKFFYESYYINILTNLLVYLSKNLLVLINKILILIFQTQMIWQIVEI